MQLIRVQNYAEWVEMCKLIDISGCLFAIVANADAFITAIFLLFKRSVERLIIIFGVHGFWVVKSYITTDTPLVRPPLLLLWLRSCCLHRAICLKRTCELAIMFYNAQPVYSLLCFHPCISFSANDLHSRFYLSNFLRRLITILHRNKWFGYYIICDYVSNTRWRQQ